MPVPCIHFDVPTNMKHIRDFFTTLWRKKILRIITVLIVLFAALYAVMPLLANREIYGTVISQYDGSFEVMATQTTEMLPNTEPWQAGKGSSVHGGDILFIEKGEYPFWLRGKIALGNEICLRTFEQRLPETENTVPLKKIVSIKVTTPFEEAAAAAFPEDSENRYVTGIAFAELIQNFNNKKNIDPGHRIAAGTPEVTKDAPYYKLILTNAGQKHPTVTLFSITMKNGKTKAAAEQYEYAKVDYKTDGRADMVFSHDNKTEALRIPLR